MIRSFLMFLAALTLGLNAAAQHQPYTTCHYHEPGSAPREHELDIERVRVEASFDCPKGLVKGRVTHTFKVLRQKVDTVFFNAPGIKIENITMAGQQQRFTMNDEGVTIHFARPLVWDQRDSLTFVYTATPRKGIYFIGWNDPNNISRKQVWTQGQGIDHRHWVPCYDDANDKVLSETIITFDKNYRVLSNGNLLSSRDNPDGTRTWHHAMPKPHSFYLMMLGIGKYNVRELKTKTGVPVRLWYYPDREKDFETTYRYSTECIEFLEEHTGVAYPWPAYSQIPVQDFIYGAMENTTATVFGDFFVCDKRDFLDRNYIGVNVHELTHQWFGDLITHRSPNHIWLHESFATFYPKLFFRKYYGQEQYQWQRRGEHNGALEAGKKDDIPVVSTRGGGSRAYPKGSAVLDMMMYTFGEDQFRRVIRHYLNHHAYGNVETNDLYQAYQDTLGLTPDWFFDQWLYRGGEPHYRISYQDVTAKAGRETHVRVEQIHAVTDVVGLFRMPVVFQVHYSDGTMDELREDVSKQTQTVVVPNRSGKTVAFVLFDPGSYILKQATFNKSFEELSVQALKAPMMIDRYDAILALRDLPLDRKRSILIQAFDREKFHAIKGEIIFQLADDRNETADALLRKAMRDTDVEVRRAVVTHLKDVPPSLQADFELLLTDSSYSIVEAALSKLAYAFPQKLPEYLAKTKDEEGGNDRRVRIKWLQWTNDADSRLKLVQYASNSYEFRTRQNAMEALKRLNYFDEAYLAHLNEALLNPNTRLAGVARTCLQYYTQQVELKVRINAFYKSRKWADWQQKLIDEAIK